MSDDLGIDCVDPSVSFLYKTMLSRDPKKRRVKPVSKHLIQVDFGGIDDSEEDSDFDMNLLKNDHNSDSAGEASEKESKASEEGGTEEVKQNNEAEAGSSGDDGSDDSEDDDDDDSDGDESNDESSSDNEEDADSSREEPAFSFNFGEYDEDEDEDYVPKKKEKQKKNVEAAQTVAPVKVKPAETKPPQNWDVEMKVNAGHIKVLICCVCLSDTNADDDEIVECDNCGVSVHEGCYGISESQSAASTESSASTEPWFCDACKAGVTPHCELCPNFGGIYKETDAGKWVHLVCALYTPGVAFGDVDKLSPVTLFEMPYVRWGARECSLCEDSRFSRTGVCISCDAGMCRTYFHVTCAQKEGLLSEAAPEEDIADPFFAYCKLHAEKNSARAKRRNWLAIQSHVRRHADRVIEDEKEKVDHSARFHRKLNRHRQKYAIAKARRPPSWVPTQKLVRFLTSSPSAVRRMLKKAELMGVITQVHHASHGHEKQETRKKQHIAPAFSSDFIEYYVERNARIENMKANMKELLNQNQKLKDQEKILRSQYDQLFAALDKNKESAAKLKKEGEKMWTNLSQTCGKELVVPEIFQSRKVPRSPTKKETPKSPPAVIHKCGICVLTTDQHLLAKCDSCKQYYHLGCLEPPLTRMPKKTKLQGWQCSECVSSSSDESVEKTNVNVNAPRRLRENIKQPQKFINMQRLEILKKERRKSSGKTGGGRKIVKKKKMEEVERKVELEEEESLSVPDSTEVLKDVEVDPEPESVEPVAKKPRIESRTPRRSKPVREEDVRTECVVCSKPGTNSNLVRCDECRLCYHFGCLNPPTKKSPKPRGYTWHCEACDPTDESEVEDDEEDADGGSEEAGAARSPSPEEVVEHVEVVNLDHDLEDEEQEDVDVEEEEEEMDVEAEVVQIDDSD